MGILDDIDAYRSAQATKARLPSPGQLYRDPFDRPQAPWGAGAAGQIATYPLNFPGWPDAPGADRRELTMPERERVAAATSWVYADITAIAREASVGLLRVTEAAGEAVTDVKNHPLEQLFAQPNPFMGRSFVLQYWMWQILLTGSAYLFLAPRGGDLAEVWPVPSSRIRPVRDPKSYVSGYEYRARVDGPATPIPAPYICWSRLPNPFDSYDGLPPLVAMWLAIQTDGDQARWNANFFGRDNAVPTSVITTKPEISNSDFLRFREELTTQFGGGQRRTLVARGGDIDVKLLQFNPTELMFDALRHMNREQIDRCLGFPEGYWSADATRANSDHAKAALISNTVWPLLTMLGEDLTAQIGHRWYGDATRVGWHDIRLENLDIKIRQAESRTYWRVNELRAVDGLPLLADDDLRGDLTLAELRAGKDLRAPAPPPPVIVPPPPALADAEDTEADDDDDAPPPAGAAEEGDETDTEAPADDDAEDTDTEGDAEAKARADLRRWEAKALARLRRGRRPACAFVSDAIPPAIAGLVGAALSQSPDAATVKAAFGQARYLLIADRIDAGMDGITDRLQKEEPKHEP